MNKKFCEKLEEIFEEKNTQKIRFFKDNGG